MPQFDSYHYPSEFLCKPDISETMLKYLTPIVFNFKACDFNEISYFLLIWT